MKKLAAILFVFVKPALDADNDAWRSRKTTSADSPAWTAL